jgi:hypothetical protein
MKTIFFVFCVLISIKIFLVKHVTSSKDITCNPFIPDPDTDIEVVGIFDCTNKNINLSNLDQVSVNVNGGSSIDFSSNHLTSIKHPENSNAFNRFTLLEVLLNLSHNQIEYIEHLKLRVQILDLSSNNIKSFDSLINNVTLPNVRKLYLNDNPLISINNTDTTSNRNSVPKLQELYLSKTNIEYIDLNYFNEAKFPNLKFIDLSNNYIKQLAEITVKIPFLNLMNNELICDCHLLWYKTYISSNEYNIEYSNYTSKYDSNCFTSDNGNSISIRNSDSNLFKCDIEINLIQNYESNQQILICTVNGFPEVNIWWTFGDKVRFFSKYL